MSWNYRILASEQKGEMYFNVHSVYYENGLPISYSDKASIIGGEDILEIVFTLNKMQECMKKPILWYGDKFPAIYRS